MTLRGGTRSVCIERLRREHSPQQPGTVALMLRARLLGAATATAITAKTAQSFFGGDPTPPPHAGPVTAESVLISARAIAAVAKIGFVCTADPGGGAPHCRVMDLRGPTDDSLTITLVTRATTRKAGELARDARCTVAFHGGARARAARTATSRSAGP